MFSIYESPNLIIELFTVEDILTVSTPLVVPATTTAPTVSTTSGTVSLSGGTGDGVIDFNELFPTQ